MKKQKKFPMNMKRLSKPLPLILENIEKIPEGAHGIYVIRSENGATQYVGRA